MVFGFGFWFCLGFVLVFVGVVDVVCLGFFVRFLRVFICMGLGLVFVFKYVVSLLVVFIIVVIMKF